MATFRAGDRQSSVTVASGTNTDHVPKVTLVGSDGATVGSEVQGNIAHDAADAGNPVKIGGRANNSPSGSPVVNNDRTDALFNLTGELYVAAGSGASDAGADARAVLISFSQRTGASTTNTPVYTAGAVFNGTSWDRQRGDTTGTHVVAKPFATGGLSIARLIASAGANIKASAGQVYGGVFTNTNAAIRYLHLYNKASAATLSTDTPVTTIPLPPNVSVQLTSDSLGAAFATGISWAFTTDDIAIPTTAGATTDIHGTLFYK